MSRHLSECVFVAGHKGMVGSAIVRRLQALGYTNIVTRDRAQLNLLDQHSVTAFLPRTRLSRCIWPLPRWVVFTPTTPIRLEFIYENLMMQANIVHAAHQHDVQKMLFLGSSCIYPVKVQQPMAEEALLTGVLEPTNEPYAIAKIAGIKLCESYNRQYGRDYRSAMPTNLYGPNDNFHPENSHVIPALLRRFHDAVEQNVEEVVIWGSGSPMREFLHVDDMASASVHIMELSPEQYGAHTEPMLSHINVGTGEDCTIRELAQTIAKVTGFKGRLGFDASKPDGAPRKLMNVSRLQQLGWRATISLEDGLRDAYSWFSENALHARSR